MKIVQVRMRVADADALRLKKDLIGLLQAGYDEQFVVSIEAPSKEEHEEYDEFQRFSDE